MDKNVFELDFMGRKLVVENGELAKQSNGAVLVRYGDTVVFPSSAFHFFEIFSFSYSAVRQ